MLSAPVNRRDLHCKSTASCRHIKPQHERIGYYHIIDQYYTGMWLKLIIYYMLLIHPMPLAVGHLPDYVSTPSNKIDQFCKLAETCIHDTIPICGRMGEEMRTFLDICDLLEFACDTNQIFNHIEDTEGCPAVRKS